MTNPGGVTSSRTLTDAACVERLFAATVGRVAFVTPGGLQVIPVNVRATGTSLMLNTSPGSSLSQLAEMGREVTLEVDEALTGSGQAWSVLIHGPIVKLDAQGRQRREAMSQQVEAWPEDATNLSSSPPWSCSGRLMQRARTDLALLPDPRLDAPAGTWSSCSAQPLAGPC